MATKIDWVQPQQSSPPLQNLKINQAKLHKSDIRAINKLIKQICGDNLNELNIYKRQSASQSAK